MHENKGEGVRQNRPTDLCADVVDEPCERRCSSRPADEPQVQADGHHLWVRGALLVQRVERVLQVREELVARIEALRRREPHVVRLQSVGNDLQQGGRSVRAAGQQRG